MRGTVRQDDREIKNILYKPHSAENGLFFTFNNKRVRIECYLVSFSPWSINEASDLICHVILREIVKAGESLVTMT